MNIPEKQIKTAAIEKVSRDKKNLKEIVLNNGFENFKLFFCSYIEEKISDYLLQDIYNKELVEEYEKYANTPPPKVTEWRGMITKTQRSAYSNPTNIRLAREVYDEITAKNS